jgi:hypothetical protein
LETQARGSQRKVARARVPEVANALGPSGKRRHRALASCAADASGLRCIGGLQPGAGAPTPRKSVKSNPTAARLAQKGGWVWRRLVASAGQAFANLLMAFLLVGFPSHFLVRGNRKRACLTPRTHRSSAGAGSIRCPWNQAAPRVRTVRTRFRRPGTKGSPR